MKVTEAYIDTWTGPVRLVLLGDLHLGNANTNEALVAEVAASLAQEHTYWVDLGDTIDAVRMNDPRFDPRSLPEWVGIQDLVDLPAAQTARYRHYFGAFGATCLARLYGNHEYTLQRYTERDIYAELNRAIGVPEERALGYSGFLRLRFRNMTPRGKISQTWTQTLYLNHGAGGGMLAGAKALRLERLPLAFEADIYAVGHTHTRMVLEKRRVAARPRANEIETRKQLLINTGAFLDGVQGYPEYRGLYPQALGPVEIWFWPSEKRLKVIY